MATQGRMALATTAFLLSLLVASTGLARPRHVRRVRHHRKPAPVAVAAAPSSSSDNLGVYVGVGLAAADLTDSYDFPDVSSEGTGLRLVAGARITDGVALELNWLGMSHEANNSNEIDAFVQAGTMDIKAYLGQPGPLEFFVLGGLGVYNFSSEDTGEDLTGPGVNLGGGVQLNLSRSLAVTARAAYHWSAIDNSTSYAAASETASMAFLDGSVMMQLRF